MYLEYFGFKESPFSIAPDPRFLYMSEGHREAFAHLCYGISGDAWFVMLTGDVGTGKTTICRRLLEQLPPDTDIAFVLNPRISVQELLATICDEFHIRYPAETTSVKVFVDFINKYLLDAYARGRRTVLILEEAQNLGADVLEQLRLLTNLETDRQKLLRIFLIGQPELRELLARPDMVQLSQRITARYHMGPLPKEEVGAYVSHRLTVAGVTRKLFPESVFPLLYSLSGGIPRVINMICDRALLGTYVQGKDQADRKIVAEAARETCGAYTGVSAVKAKLILAVLSCILLAAALASPLYEDMFTRNGKGRKAASDAGTSGDLAGLLSRSRSGENEVSAYRALFKEWNLSYREEEKGICAQMDGSGVYCLEGPGRLSELLALNRPAVLKLSDDGERKLYVTLKALQGEDAVLEIDGQTKRVSLKELEANWFGEYVLLWKAFAGFKGSIKPGYKGPEVEWVERRISSVFGLKPRQRQSDYDDYLVKRVKRFQLQKGIRPDGVIGPHTIIHLNSDSGTDEPLLTSVRDLREARIASGKGG